MLRVCTELGAQPPAFAKALIERTGVTAEEALLVFWDQAADWMCRLQFIRNQGRMTPGERKTYEAPFIEGYSADPIGGTSRQKPSPDRGVRRAEFTKPYVG